MRSFFQKKYSLEDRIAWIVERFPAIFGDRLVSIVLYGSALTDRWNLERSDVNIAVEFTGDDTDSLDWAAGLQEELQKRNISVFWFEANGLANAADVFPIELLDLKLARKILVGADPLKNVVIYRSDLRLACERFSREKLLALRSQYYASSGDEKKMRNVLIKSAPGWSAVFQGVLYLNNQNIPENAKERAQAVSEQLGIDTLPFQALFDWRKMPTSGDSVFLTHLYRSYLRAVKGFIDSIDHWETNE